MSDDRLGVHRPSVHRPSVHRVSHGRPSAWEGGHLDTSGLFVIYEKRPQQPNMVTVGVVCFQTSSRVRKDEITLTIFDLEEGSENLSLIHI